MTMEFKSSFATTSETITNPYEPAVKGGWKWLADKFLKIGYLEELHRYDKNLLKTINALCGLLLVVFCGFTIGLHQVGMRTWYSVLPAIPIYMAVLLANSVHQHKLAQYLMFFGTLSLLTFLSFVNPRVGAEYGLIAVACSVTLMSKKDFEVYLLFILSCAAYLSYRLYDYSVDFTPDPALNYTLVSSIALIITATAIFMQSFLFRTMVNKFADSLKGRNQVLKDLIDGKEVVEKTLKQKNKDLSDLTNQLNWIVSQKTKELQTYIDAIDVNICSSIIDLDGDFIKVNDPFVKLTGYPKEQLIGKNVRLIESDNQDSLISAMQTSLASGRTWRGEVMNIGKEGSVFWTDQMIIPMRIKDNHISYFLMLAFPITQRKLIEESKEKTRLLLEDIAFQTSHKIRGPLARIQGLVELVQKDLIEEAEFKNVAGRLITCSTELNLATSDLVHFLSENQDSVESGLYP